MQTAERPLTRHETAEALGGVSINTVDRLIASGELTATRIGRRRVVIQPHHLREYLDKNVDNKNQEYEEMTHAALTVLAAVKANVIDNDPEAMITALRGSSRQVSLRLVEATNIIVNLCKMSDQPAAMLAGLVAAVRNTD